MRLNFNAYGLAVGLAIVVGSYLIEHQLNGEKLLSNLFYKIGLVSLFFAIVGARLWHVFTDYYLYKDNLSAIFTIWQGGLSIFGGILGGIVGLAISFVVLTKLRSLSIKNKKIMVLKLLDYSVFGLPVGQAIGRWGNYFNQELYGLPTSGIFKIFIDKQHRLLGFENIAYYHPLFFYETLATSLFALILYLIKHKKKTILPPIGSGQLFLIYVIYYSIVRFFLDFIRIDKAMLGSGFLGTNQFILVIIVLLLVSYLVIKKLKDV